MEQDPTQKADKLKSFRKRAAEMNRTLERENIYYMRTLKKLALFENEITTLSAETGLEISAVLQEAGIDAPALLLDEAIKTWDHRLSTDKLESEDELISSLRKDFKLKIRKAKVAFVPTDDLKPQDGDGSSSRETGPDHNRVALAIQSLLHLKIEDSPLHLDDLDISIGTVPENSWRTRPYWSIALKDHGVAILLNNQYGNRTFVFEYKSKADLERISEYSKDQIHAMSDGGRIVHHFKFEDSTQFQESLVNAVLQTIEKVEQSKPYKTLEEASIAAQKLGIVSWPDYQKKRTQDPKLVAYPDRHSKYKSDWVDWFHFLGKEKKINYNTLEEAKQSVRRLNIRSQIEYNERYKEDPLLPANPYNTYDDWVDWGDYLRDEVEYYDSYAKAQAAAQELKITSAPDYAKKREQDLRLPINPHTTYNEWIDWYDYLGKERPDFYETFNEAREAARKLGCTSSKDYYEKYSVDPLLYRYPKITYEDDWTDWEDYLGYEIVQFYTYEDARHLVQEKGIMSEGEYSVLQKSDPRLPSNPYRTYDEWTNWYDFLNKSMEIVRKDYLSYEEAKRILRENGITTQKKYRKNYKKYPGLPSSPKTVYPEWIDWGDYLRDKPRIKLYKTFNEAHVAAQALRAESSTEYKKMRSKDPKLPSHPDEVYKDDWKGWPHFLGQEE